MEKDESVVVKRDDVGCLLTIFIKTTKNRRILTFYICEIASVICDETYENVSIVLCCGQSIYINTNRPRNVYNRIMDKIQDYYSGC